MAEPQPSKLAMPVRSRSPAQRSARPVRERSAGLPPRLPRRVMPGTARRLVRRYLPQTLRQRVFSVRQARRGGATTPGSRPVDRRSRDGGPESAVQDVRDLLAAGDTHTADLGRGGVARRAGDSGSRRRDRRDPRLPWGLRGAGLGALRGRSPPDVAPPCRVGVCPDRHHRRPDEGDRRGPPAAHGPAGVSRRAQLGGRPGGGLRHRRRRAVSRGVRRLRPGGG